MKHLAAFPSDPVVCTGQDLALAVTENATYSPAYFIVAIDWPNDELTPNEVDRLVEKLDKVRDEAGVQFLTTQAALTYLHSIAKQK